MNAFSPFDRFDRSFDAQMTLPQTTLPQTAVPLIQQPDQSPSLTSTNLATSLDGNLFFALLAGVWVAVVFFHIGMKTGQRQICDPTAVQQQQIQALERIWQMSAKRKD